MHIQNMGVFEIIRNVMVALQIIRIIHGNRHRILDFSLKNKFLRYPAGFVILPYIIYVLYKLAKDETIIELLTEIKPQKKLDDFL